MLKGNPQAYTEEMVAFLHTHKHIPHKEKAALFNQQFGTNLSVDSIKAKCLRLGLKTGRTGLIEKGTAAWNKGSKGLTKANVTTFKKGRTTHNHKPVGHERVTVDGYTEVKIAEPNVFQLKHRIVWEQVHGEIPKGYVIVFKNTDKSDCRLENLDMISRGELARLNQSYRHLVTPNTNESCIAMAKIKQRIHQFEKGKI
ncbi:HNH endonuclease signature motif containing protein [Acinetobacter sp. ANC 4641]|uniref:HNH endonuclease signature motif containing protein n=1 Tax=Acinetobacter sp. ANC 4641 TaxID=2529847 RepID=UPI0010408C61|nr:HNH endonuclease signature motif containing protein [Acinetobacter sp. ANC 4641]TCB12641.1 HNH endonuclease [Acinetobacter sp. ANC 4641]